MRYILFGLILLMIISMSGLSNLYAGKTNNDFEIYWSLESKGVYSSGISENYAYNMTGAKASYKRDYLRIGSYFHQFFNYQVTDGNGEYDYRAFSEAGVSLELDVYKYFNLFVEYSRAEDLDNLSKNIYYGNIEFEIASVVLSTAYTYEDFSYDINSNKIESIEKDFFLGVDYIYNDSLGFDLSYSYSNLYFDSLGSDYSKNILRFGCMYAHSGILYLMAGAGGGRDSEDYNIYGTDFGITYFVYSKFKLTFSYSFNYFEPTKTNSNTDTSGSGSGHGNSSKVKGNPYLSSGDEGESYYSHVLSLGLSVSF